MMDQGIFHCHINNLSFKKKDGDERSAVATAAYNAGERLWNDRLDKHSDFNNRADVVFREVLYPVNAPDWAKDRTSLWNKVEATAKRKDARLAKTIEASMPRDIQPDDRIALLREFVEPFISAGIIADVAIHEDGTNHNPHVHILLTTREIASNGFGAKLKGIEQRQFVTKVRVTWANLNNKYLEKAGSTQRVDHRSYKAQGIDQVPTTHRGPNREERVLKREHAQRIREEKTMAIPSLSDQQDFPLLAQRSWPPEQIVPPDMTLEERDEHHRYWQDRQIEQLEVQRENDPGFPAPEKNRDAAQTAPERAPVLDKYAQAIERAKIEAGWEITAKSQKESIERTAPRESHLDMLYRRALSLNRTKDETELLEMASAGSVQMKTFVRDHIISGRMRRIEEADNQRRKAELERHMDSTLKERFNDLLTRPQEREGFPEMGPNNELRPSSELAPAKDDLIQELERDVLQPSPTPENNDPKHRERTQNELLADMEHEEPDR